MSWGSIGSAAIGAGSSYMMSQQEGGGTSGGGGASGQFGPSVISPPQYSFTEPRMRLTSDFISDNIERMGRGEYPSYYGKALPQLRENQSRQLRDTYFGGQGLRGNSVMSQIRATGAALGTGPKGVISRENKALADYADKETAIDEYLTKLGVDIMQTDAQRFPDLAMRMPMGPGMSVQPGAAYQVPQKEDYMGKAMASMAKSWADRETPDTNAQTTPGYEGNYNAPDYYYQGYDSPGSFDWYQQQGNDIVSTPTSARGSTGGSSGGATGSWSNDIDGFGTVPRNTSSGATGLWGRGATGSY